MSVLERKLQRSIPALLAHPPILAHTIYQALAFDTALTDEGFDLPGTTLATADDKDSHWDGISDEILGKQEWFEAWVEGERKCKDISDALYERGGINKLTQLQWTNTLTLSVPLTHGS